MIPAVNRWVIGGIAVAIAVGLALYYRNSAPSLVGNGPATLVGTSAPSFPMKRIDRVGDSLERHRGKVVVMNLWASWCPPCRAEMPDLQRLATRYGSRGLVVLGVDEGESLENAASFARSLRITFPILLDPEQQYGRVYSALGLPTTIIVRPNGLIARGIDGALTYEQMQEAIVPLLGR